MTQSSHTEKSLPSVYQGFPIAFLFPIPFLCLTQFSILDPP